MSSTPGLTENTRLLHFTAKLLQRDIKGDIWVDDNLTHRVTSAIDQRVRAGPAVACSTRCSIPGDPRVAERERWFLSRNWRRWLHTSGALHAHGIHPAGSHLVRTMIHPSVCGLPGTLGNG